MFSLSGSALDLSFDPKLKGLEMPVRIKCFFLSLFTLFFLGFPLSAGAQFYQWKNVAIMGGGFVSGIVASPVSQGLFYARTDVGGAYRWNDSTSTWTPITDMFSMAQGNYLGIESIMPDPVDPNVVYAAAGMYIANGNGVILRSADQGNTWTWTVNNIGIPMGGNAVGRGMGERLAVDPNKNSILFFGSRNNGLWTSIDSGTSWNQIYSFPTNGAITFGLPLVIIDGQGGTPGNASSTLFVAAATVTSGSNLYESTDGGSNWNLVPNGPSGMMAHHGALGSDGNLWLAYSNDYGPYNITGVSLQGQVWKYNVHSGGWTNVTPSGIGGMMGGLSVDAQNPLNVAVATLDWYNPDRIYYTSDGGSNWAAIAQPNSSGSQYDVNGAQYLYFGGSSVGSGATNWVEGLAIDPFNSNRAFYGTGEGVFVSNNIRASSAPQSVTWVFQDSGLEETVPLDLVSSVNGAFLGAVGDVGGMRNASLTSPSASGMYKNPVFSSTSGIDFAGLNPNIVARVGTGTTGQYGAYSTDNGQTWQLFSTMPTGANNSNNRMIAVAADGSIFLWGLNHPVYSNNNGSSWVTCAGLPSGVQVAADRVNPDWFYATGTGSLYASTNGGANFTSVATFTGSGRPRAVFGVQGEVWVAANGGALYQFTNVGGSPVTTTPISGVSNAWGVGFGKAAPGQSHPAVYIIGTVAGQYGFFRCDDGVGTSWSRINDDQHQFGWLQGNYIGGDENVYGRAFLTTAGRGYVYGDIWLTPTATATATSTPTPTPTHTPCFVNGTPCTPSVTPTPTVTITPTATSTPYPGATVGVRLAPNVLRAGEAVYLLVDKPVKATHWKVYTTSGERVASLDFGSDTSPHWKTASVASGLYFIRIKLDYTDGTSYEKTYPIAVIR